MPPSPCMRALTRAPQSRFSPQHHRRTPVQGRRTVCGLSGFPQRAFGARTGRSQLDPGTPRRPAATAHFRRLSDGHCLVSSLTCAIPTPRSATSGSKVRRQDAAAGGGRSDRLRRRRAAHVALSTRTVGRDIKLRPVIHTRPECRPSRDHRRHTIRLPLSYRGFSGQTGLVLYRAAAAHAAAHLVFTTQRFPSAT